MLSKKEYLERANAKLNSANNILEVTLPIANSPKLLLSGVEHIFLSMDYAMNAILISQKEDQKIPQFNKSFTSRYSTFRLNISNRLGFSKCGVEQLYRLRAILLEYQQSPMVFERNNSLVICSSDYKMTILSQELLSNYLRIAKEFLAISSSAIEQSLSTSPHS